MKTAIVYYSKYGTTESVAHLIGEKIDGEISYISLRKFSNPDIQAYDSVILGTSIYTGNPAKLMTRFCQMNRAILEQKRIGLYICCMQEESNEIKQMANAYPEWLHQVAIIEIAAGGEFHFDKMNFIERFLTKKIAKIGSSISRLRYDAIEKFAVQMANTKAIICKNTTED